MSEAEGLEPAPEPAAAKPRRVQSGIATAAVVLSAHASGNAELFPQIMALHVPPGTTERLARYLAAREQLEG